mmetsp:Transcript_135185/g.432102  ORF Transcript_135185/g.432102 Transcript_135185/m.432102 type:complete len:361 (-) Transcript_135185:119-1201(-)
MEELASWRRLPTGWIHLLWVECFHIYLSVLSWHSLVTTVNSRCAQEEHHIGTSRIDSYFSDLFFFGHAREVKLTFNHGTDLVLPAAYIWDEGINIPWIIIGWTLPSGALALLLFILWSFAAAGSWSFESARYLNFTWHLARKRPYRVCVALMSAGPVLLPVTWFLQVVVWTSGNEALINLSVMKSCTMSGLMLLFSLNLLAFPTAPVHFWHGCEEFLELRFRRSCLSLFLQSNSSFGMKLMDALWTAQHGDSSRLRRYVPEEGDVERVLDICRRAQREEAQNKKAFEMAKFSDLDYDGSSSASSTTHLDPLRTANADVDDNRRQATQAAQWHAVSSPLVASHGLPPPATVGVKGPLANLV